MPRNAPQDGRINVRIKGEEIDIRVSTVPTVYGESVSLRLLTRGSVLKGMDTLGMSREIETPSERSFINRTVSCWLPARRVPVNRLRSIHF